MHSESLPETLGNLVRGELAQGEVVRWVAQPKPGRWAIKSLGIALFGIPFAGFAVFWIIKGFEMNAWTAEHFPDKGGGMDLCFPLFGLPFVLVGLAMLSSPLWMMYKANQTAYVITDRRAIVLEGGWGIHIRSFGPGDIDSIRRTLYADGTGDVVFAKELTGTSSGGRVQIKEWGFYAVPNPKEAEELLAALRSSANRSGA